MEGNLPAPELGHPTTPPRAPQLSTKPSESKDLNKKEEEDEDDKGPVPKKKRTLKRDTREWTLLLGEGR